MTSTPFSDRPADASVEPQRIGGRLRHRLLAIWLGSILGVLLLVGVVLTTLMDDFRSREARRDIANAVTQLRHELVASASDLLRQADLLALRREVVATANLVHRYQNVERYQALVFDGEKRQLGLMLADRLASADLHFAAVYDGHGRPAAFALSIDGQAVPGYHTVRGGNQTLMADSETGWQPAAMPPYMRAGAWTDTATEGDVTFHAHDGRLYLETFAAIERNLPNAPSLTVGYVHLVKVIGYNFLASHSNRSGVGLAIQVEGRQEGPLSPLEIPAGLDPPDIARGTDCPCDWIEADDLRVGVTSLQLDDGGRALILAGSSDESASAMVRYYQMAAILVLLAAAGIVAPGGLLLLDNTIVAPLSRLLAGVEALRQGRHVRLGGRFRDNEFGALARGFDAMADSIAEREEELRGTIDHLARSNAELERFAFIAAHDLQEPLRLVASYTQLLKRRYQGRLDADADEFIDYAVEGAERMKVLIQSLLDYSRVDGDQAVFGPVDCQEVLDNALRVLAPMIEECGGRVTAQPLPAVRGNAAQLAQVFQNLLVNALKFRREAPRIEIAAHREGHQWVFSVRDNGIGIPAEYLPQLFTLFRRLHTRQEYPGAGLGLAIARRIIERHGGRIWAESQEGVGTTITFTLPG